MHPKFVAAIELLHGKFGELLAGPARKFGELPVRMPKSGVYLFSEGSAHLYVGRSNRLRARYFLHCRPGSRQNQASLAFKLTREALGAPHTAYRAGKSSRAGLAVNPDFQNAFSSAKERLRLMDYRCVEETDQTRQALLEAYCAIARSTPYDDFDTH
jgi:hypothetical protein